MHPGAGDLLQSLVSPKFVLYSSRPREGSLRVLAGLLLMGVLLAGLVPVANASAGLGATLFRGTGSFMMYRFIDSGVAVETLDAYCDERDWHSCAYRDEFARHVGLADGWFLFRSESPFFTHLGGWKGQEQNEIVAHAFQCCWPSILSTTIAGAWEQLWRVDSHDGVAQNDTEPVRSWLKDARWTELSRLLMARQARGEPVRVLLHPIPEVGLQAVFAIAAIVVGMLGWQRGDRRIGLLLGSVLIFLMGNAIICSFGSSIHDRYQGRIAWLLPWALTLAMWWWLNGPTANALNPHEEPISWIAGFGGGVTAQGSIPSLDVAEGTRRCCVSEDFGARPLQSQRSRTRLPDAYAGG
jgi:hypothetical protein